MKKITLSIMILGIFFWGHSGLNAYDSKYVTVREVVSMVKKKFNKLESFQAYFTIASTKMGKQTTQQGRVRYKSSDKLLVEFNNGQKIVSNGKMMWIYVPHLNVIAEQDLHSDKGLFGSTKGGMQRLFAKYHYRFASKKQPEELKEGKFYTLILKQRESRSGFRTLKLWISEDFIITRAEGDSSTGKNVEITFSNIKTNVGLKNGIFKIDTPSSTHTLKNPMMIEVK